MSDRDAILSAVGRAERRLNAARFVTDLAAGVCVVLALALLLELASIVLPAAGALVPWVAAVGLAGAALGPGLWRLGRRAPERAAAALDRAAGLGDELRSAHWFLGRGEGSPWLDVLVRRAAARAAALDVRRLVPVRVPRREAAGALVLAAAVVGIGRLPLDLAHQWITPPAVTTLTPEEQARLDRLQQLLDRIAPDLDMARRERIAALVARLRGGGLTAEETLAIVAELRRLVGEPLTSEAERQALARAAAALEGADLTREAGRALGAGALEDAADRMADLASTLSTEAGPGARQAIERAGRETAAVPGALGGHLQQAADAMRSGETDAARTQLAQAAGDLKAMAAAWDRQEIGRMAGRQLEELEKAFGERFRSPGQSARGAAAAGRQPLKSDDLSPEGARKMPGAGQGQAVAGRSAQQEAGSAMAQGDRSNAPGPLGGPAGPSGAAQSLGEQVRRRLELLAAGKATGEAPGRQEVDEATRASRVTVPYEPIAPRASYAPADPLTSDVVPWQSRPLVKTYFQVLGPRGAGGK